MYNSTDDDFEYDSNFTANSSGTINIGASCCGILLSSAVPLILIICGVLLTGKPTTETQNAIKVVYFITASLGLINNLCSLAIGCISHWSLFVSCCFFGSSVQGVVLKNITAHFVGLSLLLFSCFNLLGPIVLLTCGILLSTGTGSLYTIGIISVITGTSIYLASFLSCCVTASVICCGLFSICAFESTPED